MTTAVVLGASAAGSVTALQLARAGWQVLLVDPELELLRGATDVAEQRAGAPHVVQAHVYQCRVRAELSHRLPDVHADLLAAGVHEVSLTDLLSPDVLDGGRPGDEDLTAYQSRRVTFDRVLTAAVGREPGITAVTDRCMDLVVEGPPAAAPADLPRVVGVRLRDGGRADAEVVVDCSGRRSPVHGWLDRLGLAVPPEVWDCGVRYYGRNFVVGPGARPPLNAGIATVSPHPTLDLLWFPGDGDTAMLAAGAHGSDDALKALRRPEALMAVARESPAVAPWLEQSRPETTVFVMGAIHSTLQRMTREGEPVVLGVHHVGDSLATTNPLRGRGLSLAFASAGVLVDLLTSGSDDAAGTARRYDAWIERTLTPWFREAATADRQSGLRKRAALAGEDLPAVAPRLLLPEDSTVTLDEIERAARIDADVARSLMRADRLLDDERDIGSPRTQARVRRVLADADADTAPAQGPTNPPPPCTLDDPAAVAQLVAPWR